MSWQNSQIILPTIQSGVNNAGREPDVGNACEFKLDDLLPIDLIRVHTKTDDIPSVTDEQLTLYRQAALESAEQYTGFVFSGSKPIQEVIDKAYSNRDLQRGFFTYNLKFPSMDGIVYLYGTGQSLVLHTRIGSRSVKIPVLGMSLDVSSACCRGPCDGEIGKLNPGARVLYRTGFESIDAVPAGIKLGMLKFCAWCITHPGDEITAVRNRTITRSSLVDGTNNVAWASGAIEMWRQYDPEAI